MIANSERIAEILHESNPAPIGSDSWMRNYRESVAIEREARAIDDRIIPAAEAELKYVLNAKDAEFRGGFPAVRGCSTIAFFAGNSCLPTLASRSVVAAVTFC